MLEASALYGPLSPQTRAYILADRIFTFLAEERALPSFFLFFFSETRCSNSIASSHRDSFHGSRRDVSGVEAMQVFFGNGISFILFFFLI